jgi:hypothetical protein
VPVKGIDLDDTSRLWELPSGWDEHGIQEIVEYYDNQTDEEAAAEHEAALSSPAGSPPSIPDPGPPPLTSLPLVTRLVLWI